jgi:HEAT repeat protein
MAMRRAIFIVLAEILMYTLAISQVLPAGIDEAAGGQRDLETFQRMTASEVARKYLEHPPYSLLAIRRLIELGDARVVPELRRAFAKEKDPTRRQFIAAALVSLNNRDPQYFDYIQAAARSAIKSALPFPVLLNQANQSGKESGYRPEFLRAVREQQLEFNVALQQAAIELPGAIEALAEAADKRAFPTLVQGLGSLNIAIVRAAAFGLARLHDNAGIAPIISVCARLSPQERPLVGKSLLYFDSAAARREAESTIGDSALLERWREEAKQRGWKRAMRDSLR